MAQVQTDKDGKATGTTRAHYAAMVRMGRTEFQAKLDGPGLSPAYRPLWAMYQEVSEGRSPGGMGPSVLTWADVVAWSTVTGATVDGWEAAMLFAMDAAVRAGLAATD